MNQNEKKTAWIVSGILLVLLVIVLYLWVSTKADLNTVLENGKISIKAEQAQIAEDCQGAKADKAACKQDLADLSDILKQFSANVQEASTSTSTAAY
jgi:tryptophanyl-tRNA synthetase